MDFETEVLHTAGMLDSLRMWDDFARRAPAAQMAVDEALLGSDFPVIRFYRWASPAVTFGYAQRHADALSVAGPLPVVRRWTGGGTVFHGRDLTVCLAIPARHALDLPSAAGIYLAIHSAFLSALRGILPDARLAGCGDCLPGAVCFESPALHDILVGRLKICGGALRKGRQGILYQGSLHAEVQPRMLAGELCGRLEDFIPDEALDARAEELEIGKYSSSAWNAKR